MAHETASTAEPEAPGTSVKYQKGRLYTQYIISFLIAGTILNMCYAAMAAVLMPNTVQTIEFLNYFANTGIGTVNDLASLTDLAAQVAAGTVQPTAEQAVLLDLLSKYEGSRASDMALIFAIGSFVTMFSQPLVGVFSDRWRSRWGRRSFWIVVGAIAGASFMVALRYSSTIAMVILFWVLSQVSLNFMQGPLTATIADRVHEKNIGSMSAVSGFSGLVGFGAGTAVAGIVFNAMGSDTYFAFALAVAVGALVFVTFAKDRSSKDLKVDPWDWKGFFHGFTIAFRSRDFRWVWFARAILWLGYAAVANFSLYILQSHLRPALTAEEANVHIGILSLVALPCQIVTVLLAGRLSDKVGRRKPFVWGSSSVMAASIFIPLLVPTLPAYYAFTIIFYAAFGVYMAVDMALFIDVLPDKDQAGRDLGVANVATNVGDMLGPVLAGMLVAQLGGYPPVFIAAGIAVFAGALGILRVRNAR